MAEQKIHYVVVEVTFDKPVLEREARWSLAWALEEHFTRQKDYRHLYARRVKIPSRPSMRITNTKQFSKVAAYHRRGKSLWARMGFK